MAEDTAVVDGAVGADLGDQGGVDESGVQDVAAPPATTRMAQAPAVVVAGT
ncbi:hypothetical protein [Streptomyces sp. NRRL F-2580]|uniref:hypothetical protein n=1 Tax=Streptomyces sp. NRRL F-2580 TaxID=1463841 RepID=UPI00131A8091|nr:hypothetical protein [Streptomyces sp. NRRL F-2580]